MRIKLIVAFIKPSTLLSTIQISWVKSNSEFLSTSDSSLEKELKRIFRQNKSDKSTRHDYHIPYSRILASLSSKGAVLEIGIGTNNLDVPSNMGLQGTPGASLRSWRDTNRFMKIYGADVDKRILFKENKIETYFVDQLNIESIDTLKNSLINTEFPINLVIDDGLHTAFANINTFQILFEIVDKGGFYVIEDIHINDIAEIVAKISILSEIDWAIYSNPYCGLDNRLLIIRKNSKKVYF